MSGLFELALVQLYLDTLLGNLVQLDLEELEALVLEDLEVLGLEELEAMVLEELEALGLEELEALVVLALLEDLEVFGNWVQTAAPRGKGLPGKPPPSGFSSVVVQPMPKRWKRLRTGREGVSPIGLALPPEGDRTQGPVEVSDRVGIG